ncbi:hypothetical protein T35B1_18108 [Salinisphaera shabanensis T35B1]|jgi:acetoin utilization deacetylase AcuC-like enzyme|uniref:hypothetical protein n=1 Tax=Salinisphaera shabanensis TaxID=180542 RepID=UPI003341236E
MTELAIGASNNAVSPTGAAVHVNAKPESAQADQPEATPKVQAVANDLAAEEKNAKIANLQAQIQELEQQLRWEIQALEVAQVHVTQSSNAVQAGEAGTTGEGVATDRSEVQAARSRVAGTQAMLQVAKTQLTQALVDSGRGLAGSTVDVRV